MKNNITEVVFVLDRSGSMRGKENDTIGGFNSIIEKQKEQEGEVYISTVLFDHESLVLHDREKLENVKEMTREDYTVRGCTALLDALGGAIKHTAKVHKYIRKEDIPENVLFVIITDGMENASRNYTYSDIKKMVEKEKEEYGWEFLFMGANIDAFSCAENMGIDRDFSANYICDDRGTKATYACVSESIALKRQGRRLQKNWKEKIDEDYNKRK